MNSPDQANGPAINNFKYKLAKKQRIMKEKLMTDQQISDEIEYEDRCKINDLLQNMLNLSSQNVEYNVFMLVNDEDENEGWVIRDKKTGEDLHL